MATTTIKSIPFEEIVDIQISGAFYMRIQNLFFELISKLSDEEQKTLLEKVREGGKDITEPSMYNAVTVLILMNEIEYQAGQQNKVKDQEVELPSDESDVQ